MIYVYMMQTCLTPLSTQGRVVAVAEDLLQAVQRHALRLPPAPAEALPPARLDVARQGASQRQAPRRNVGSTYIIC